MRGDGGPDGPVGSGASGGSVDGVDAIEGPSVGGAGLPMSSCESSEDPQTTADGWGIQTTEERLQRVAESGSRAARK